MSIPSGEIIARPMVARACGCLQEFQHFAVDKYRTQRLAKFQKTRCSSCVAKLNEEQRQAAASLPKKGEAFQLLPNGTKLSMTRRTDGSWAGTLTADGKTVEAIADSPQGLSVSLARQWVIAHKPGSQTTPTAGPASTAGPAPNSAPAPKPSLSAAAKPTPSPAPKPVPSAGSKPTK